MPLPSGGAGGIKAGAAGERWGDDQLHFILYGGWFALLPLVGF